jgi:hypothetical protein
MPLSRCFLMCALLLPGALPAIDRSFVPAASRQAEIAAALPDEPWWWGAPAEDRATWVSVAADLPVPALLQRATELAAQAPPELTGDAYRRFTRDGNRSEYQDRNRARMNRLRVFAWAEALEGRGRWMEALEAEIAALLAEPTWVIPAHDRELHNLEGRVVEIDLMVAMKGWSLAQVLAWHGAKLDPALRAAAEAELRRRVIDPYLEAMRGGGLAPGMWWVRADNNWNAVCHTGVVGTALALPLARELQAEIIAHAELNLEFYLRGFTPDGYCSEGIGYWNYGFGHFAMLSETLARATGGLVRPLAGEHALHITAYPWRLRLLPGIFPAYADMNPRERPSTWFGALAVKQLHPEPLGIKPWNLSVDDLATQLVYESAMRVFLPRLTAGLPPAPAPQPRGERHWFADAQVYSGRASPRFAASIKGGHNAEHHNHNDVGSYVVAVGDRAVLVDPGMEVYTARTFGPRRYESNVMNSYGHPVPKVAGRLQLPGRQHAARVVRTEFTPAADTVVLDLTAAYDAPELVRLVRTFTVRRQPRVEVVIVDEVEMNTPAAFETALITFEPWRANRRRELTIGSGETVVSVLVEASSPWQLVPDTLTEDLPQGRVPVRLGLQLEQPVERARIITTIRPR